MEIKKRSDGKNLETIWGKIAISNDGYYHFINGKYKGKSYHRIIAMKYFGSWINDWSDGQIDVHHIDGNRLNNCVLNLEPLYHEDHIRLHMTGKERPELKKRNLENNPMWNEETRRKVSEKIKGKRAGKDNPMWGKKRPDLTERNLKNNPTKNGEEHPNYRKDVPSGEELLNELIEQNTNIYQLCIKYNCSYNTIKRRVNDAKSKK